MPDRDDYIIDEDNDDENNSSQSDLIRIVIQMAYFNEYDLNQMEFTPEGIMKFAGDREEREATQQKIDGLRDKF